MKLVNIGNRRYPEYRTEDYRFRVAWADRQGARSGYVVHKVAFAAYCDRDSWKRPADGRI